ncbi:hypothetical protein D3C76_1491220 [compost metagenome]
MPRLALLQLAVFIRWKTLGPQGHRLINPHPLADDRGLADYHTGPVVDEEAAADLRARVNVDAGSRMGDFCAYPRQQRQPCAI